MEQPEQLKPFAFKPGQSGNPGGRPKGGLKDYDRKRFLEMSDEDKEKFLSSIPSEVRYKMAEGNPATTTDLTTKGEAISFTVVKYGDDKPPIQT